MARHEDLELVCEPFVDDGISGVTMDRPGFADMIQQLEQGKAAAVFVKDLSRLGRDYVTVGQYTDIYFPDHNVRFIAINDLVDSDEGENEIAPFKNVMNEMYARDISRKVRSAHRIRGTSGEPLSQPPYGYMKSPENKKKWIIDPEAAAVVKDIFKMTLEGKGAETIARILQERKVLVPMAYWQSKGLPRGGKKHSLTRISGVKPAFLNSSLNRNIAAISSILKPAPNHSKIKRDMQIPKING